MLGRSKKEIKYIMSSAQTFTLRGIILLEDEALQNFGRTLTTLNSMYEKYSQLASINSTYKELVDDIQKAKTQMAIGVHRLSVAHSRLEKGAILEEEKEAAKKKAEQH